MIEFFNGPTQCFSTTQVLTMTPMEGHRMAKSKRTIKRERTKADEILFVQAYARLTQIFELVEEYNEIACALTDLGYVLPDPDDFPGAGEIPRAHVDGWNRSISPEDLSEFWKAGPVGRLKPIQRIPLTSERLRLGEETTWTCFYCRLQGDDCGGPDGRVWHVDHPYPVIRGGDDAPDNHVLSCATCNLEKKARTAAEYFKAKILKEHSA